MKYLGKKFRRIFLITTLIVAILSCYLNINSAKDYYSQFTSKERIEQYFDNNEVIPNGAKMLGVGGEVVIFLTTPGAGTWTVPDDWNSANNSIECIGGGGGGGYNHTRAGGGGAYSKINNLSLNPGNLILYSVGIGGGEYGDGEDTWFGNSSYASANVGAKGGASSNTGGSSASGIGDVKYSGGNGNSWAGGGAAGPNGNGGDPTGSYPDYTGGVGGAGYGGAGGYQNSGGDGTEWDSTHGSGGGGGYRGSYSGGGNGGKYGGGGAGNGTSGGKSSGSQGLIVITYTPFISSGNFNLFFFN